MGCEKESVVFLVISHEVQLFIVISSCLLFKLYTHRLNQPSIKNNQERTQQYWICTENFLVILSYIFVGDHPWTSGKFTPGTPIRWSHRPAGPIRLLPLPSWLWLAFQGSSLPGHPSGCPINSEDPMRAWPPHHCYCLPLATMATSAVSALPLT